MNALRSSYTALFVCWLGLIVLFFSANYSDVFDKCFSTQQITKEWKLTTLKNVTDTENLASSVRCKKRLDSTSFCRFKNLYHFPKHKGYLFFLLNKYSVISGVESSKFLKEISLSTVQKHSGLYLKLVILKTPEYLLHEEIYYLDTDVLIMNRFKPDNIMHIIHDDLLPLFLTYKELCEGNIQLCLSTYQLMFLDNNDKGTYFEWYTLFSNYRPLLLSQENIAICIKNSVIGLSQESIWFQYGFKNVQGPTVNTHFNGFHLNEFTKFIKHQFGIEDGGGEQIDSESEPIAFFNRKANRKILNDSVVEERIKEIYQNIHNKSVNIVNVDLSTNNSKCLISLLQKTNILIGMHGSAMILAIFLPQGSNIIELFPFGIQPEYVSPLKALCSLPNIFYNYEGWVNMNESNTRTHPEHSLLHGGILHLPLAEQEHIKSVKSVPPVECCHNPVYLFRMFQDTVVDESFYTLVFRVFTNKINLILNEHDFSERQHNFVYNLWYFPPPVFNLMCKCSDMKLTVLWNFPFDKLSGVKFSIATNSGVSAITELSYFKMETKDCGSDSITYGGSQSSMSVWVKTLEDHKESIDSYIQCTTF